MIWQFGEKVFGFLTILGIFYIVYSLYKNDMAKKSAVAATGEVQQTEVTPPRDIKKSAILVFLFAIGYGVCRLLAM